jgi:hypothetical protein
MDEGVLWNSIREAEMDLAEAIFYYWMDTANWN